MVSQESHPTKRKSMSFFGIRLDSFEIVSFRDAARFSLLRTTDFHRHRDYLYNVRYISVAMFPVYNLLQNSLGFHEDSWPGLIKALIAMSELIIDPTTLHQLEDLIRFATSLGDFVIRRSFISHSNLISSSTLLSITFSVLSGFPSTSGHHISSPIIFIPFQFHQKRRWPIPTNQFIIIFIDFNSGNGIMNGVTSWTNGRWLKRRHCQ